MMSMDLNNCVDSTFKKIYTKPLERYFISITLSPSKNDSIS